MLLSGAPAGAPLGSASTLTLLGAGFASLSGAQCAFTPLDAAGAPTGVPGSTLLTAAHALDDTRAECAPPRPESAAAYSLALALGEGDAESTVEPLFGAVTFELYELGAVSVASVHPPGGPVRGGTVVTVLGAGFAEYGAGQLCCVLPGARSGVCAAPATLLAEAPGGVSRARCTLPAAPAGEPGEVALEMSLGNGTAETTTSSGGATFRYYLEPEITAVVPASGGAGGGTSVGVLGVGLDGLGESSLLRVRFGDADAEPPTRGNGSHVGVVTRYGAAGRAAVRVSLNGQQFTPAEGAEEQGSVFFEFVGLHAPRLLSARFNAQATALLLRFDAQPTDRAGMSGAQPCSVVLDDGSVDLLRGGGSAAPLCYWADDSTLVAQLSALTTVRPGSALALRGAALLPRACADGCAEREQLYAAGGATIDADAPFGVGVPGPTPIAAISGPSLVSNCPDASITLDASASVRGGIGPATFEWRVDPSRSARAAALNAHLRALPADTAVLALGGDELGVRGAFVFVLRVTSWLGHASEPAEHAVLRSGGASPSLSLLGPAARELLAPSALLLQGRADLAPCWPPSFEPAVEFAWRLVSVEPSPAESAANASAIKRPDLSAARASELLLAPFSLSARHTYTFELSASMAAAPTQRATATVRVAVQRQPLRAVLAGGDRRVPAAQPLRVDASASHDPNEGESASASSGLAFAWSVVAEGDGAAVALPEPSASSAVLELPPGALEVGFYALTLTLSKPGFDAVSASARVEAVAEHIPTLSVAPLRRAKLSADWELGTERLALRTRLDAASEALRESGAASFAYAWAAVLLGDDGAELDAGLALHDTAAVTTTGAAGPSLGLRPGVLTPGATYSFRLLVSASGGAFAAEQRAYAEVRVTINRPPYGGELSVEPAAGGVALQTRFRLRAPGWADDAEDLPLSYAFAQRRAGAEGGGASLGAAGAASTTDALLPAGNRTLSVVVRDALGARASADASALVRAPPALSAESLVGLLERARAEVAIGQGGRANQLVGVIAGLLPSSEPAASGNASLLGEALDVLLGVTHGAAAAGASTAESRALAASTLGALLGSVEPSALSASAQHAALAQVAALSAQSAEEGMDARSVRSLLGALDAALAAPTQGLSAADADAIGGAATDAATGLAGVLLAGALAGEPAAELLGAAVNLTARRASASELRNGTLGGPGGAGAVELPQGVFHAQSEAALEGGVDAVIWAMARNVHGANSSAGSVEGGLATPVFSVTLYSAASGAALRVSGLDAPVLLRIPLGAEAEAGGGGSSELACIFWDEAAREWAGDGCAAVPGPEPSLHYCACTHLTDFAGVSVPSSADGAREDVESFTINTLSVDELGRPLTSAPSLETNPYIYAAVIGLSAACALSVALFGALDARDARRRRARLAALTSRLHPALPPPKGAALDSPTAKGSESARSSTSSESRTTRGGSFSFRQGLRTLRGRGGTDAERRRAAANAAQRSTDRAMERLAQREAADRELKRAAAREARRRGGAARGAPSSAPASASFATPRPPPPPADGGAATAAASDGAAVQTLAQAIAAGLASRPSAGAEAEPREPLLKARAASRGDLADQLEARLDALDDLVAQKRHAAAASMQRVFRGRRARAAVATIAPPAAPRGADRTRDHAATALLRRVLLKIQSDHSLLGIAFADPQDAKRAELAQTFWSVAMLGLLITCMLYSTSDAPAEGSSERINLIHALLAALLTAALTAPALALFRALFRWGYGRRAAPLSKRVFAAFLRAELQEREAERAPFSLSVRKGVASALLQLEASRSSSRSTSRSGSFTGGSFQLRRRFSDRRAGGSWLRFELPAAAAPAAATPAAEVPPGLSPPTPRRVGPPGALVSPRADSFGEEEPGAAAAAAPTPPPQPSPVPSPRGQRVPSPRGQRERSGSRAAEAEGAARAGEGEARAAAADADLSEGAADAASASAPASAPAARPKPPPPRNAPPPPPLSRLTGGGKHGRSAGSASGSASGSTSGSGSAARSPQHAAPVSFEPFRRERAEAVSEMLARIERASTASAAESDPGVRLVPPRAVAVPTAGGVPRANPRLRISPFGSAAATAISPRADEAAVGTTGASAACRDLHSNRSRSAGPNTPIRTPPALLHGSDEHGADGTAEGGAMLGSPGIRGVAIAAWAQAEDGADAGGADAPPAMPPLEPVLTPDGVAGSKRPGSRPSKGSESSPAGRHTPSSRRRARLQGHSKADALRDAGGALRAGPELVRTASGDDTADEGELSGMTRMTIALPEPSPPSSPPAPPPPSSTGAPPADSSANPPRTHTAAPPGADTAAPAAAAPDGASAIMQPSAGHNLDEVTIELLRHKFKLFDADDSGYVDLAEFGALLDNLGFRLGKRRVRALAKELDADGDGVISFTELVDWYDEMVEEEVAAAARAEAGLRGVLTRALRATALPPRVRLALAWLSMWAIFVALALLAMAYAFSFGNEQTRYLLFSWTLAEGQTLSIEEPVVIAVIVLVPLLFDRLLATGGATGEAINELLATTVGICVHWMHTVGTC